MTQQVSATRPIRLGPTRARVLAELRQADDALRVRDLARLLDLHPNTVRFHLDNLCRAGLVSVELERQGKRGRPSLHYRAAARPADDPFRELAGALVRHIARSPKHRRRQAEAAGLSWGEELRAATPDEEPLGRVLRCMGTMGYHPEFSRAEPPTITLRPCPFQDLAVATPEVVCRLHLGLMRGLLGSDAGWQVTDLEPWATPVSCVARLARVEPS